MADTRVRIRINGTAEAGTGTEYTSFLYKCKTRKKRREPGTFDITLNGTNNTSDIAVGNVIEVYFGTTMSVANRFFKGKIKVIEEQTAKLIRLTGYEAGWAELVDRKHTNKAEYGTDSRKTILKADGTTSAVTNTTRSQIVDYLRSRNLDGTGDNLVAAGTIVSGGSAVSLLHSDLEFRHLPFLRLADDWNTDLFFDQDGSGNDKVNLTTQGTNKIATHVFNLSGTSKNAKIGSNVLDQENQFTQVTVIGAGDGYTQAIGSYPSATTYDPEMPEKELVVQRPDLKTNVACQTTAQTIHSVVKNPVRRIRFAPDVPGDWLTNTGVGDTIRLAQVNLAHICAPGATPCTFDTKIHEVAFDMDFESGMFELVFQTENRATMPFDSQINSQYSSSQHFQSSQYENTGLNLLRDANSGSRISTGNFLNQTGLLGKMAWFSLAGLTAPASLLGESNAYPLRLMGTTTGAHNGTHTAGFRGHFVLSTGVTADPTIDASLIEGAFYYNSSTNRLRFFDGVAWADVGTGVGGGGEWTRTLGTPNFLAPTNANDHVRPNGTADLGATTARWANIYGTNLDVTGGTIGGTGLLIIGDLLAQGNTALGNATSDTITATGRFASSLIPATNNLYDLGTISGSTQRWRTLYLQSGASINGSMETNAIFPLTTVTYDLGLSTRRWREFYASTGALDIVVINTDLSMGGSARVTGSMLPSVDNSFDLGSAALRWRQGFFSLGLTVSGGTVLNGNVTLGDNVVDVINVVGRFGTSLIPGITNSFDLGSAALTWRDLFIRHLDASGNATIDGNLICDGNVILGSSAADTIDVNADFISNLRPDTTNNFDLGGSSNRWRTLYLQTGASINGNMETNAIFPLTTVTYDLGTSTRRWREFYASTGALDIVVINTDLSMGGSARVTGDFIPSVNNSFDLGSSALRWADGWFAGTVTKGAGSFVIDHPSDPGNKVLRHSFVESPDMLNIYTGEAKFQNGKCKVFLPPYFKHLNGSPFKNRDMTFQFTSIAGPQIIWGEWEEEGDLIVINVSGQKPDGSPAHGMFYWLVTSVRHDKFAEKNRIIVEEEKKEKGSYIHPECFQKEGV